MSSLDRAALKAILRQNFQAFVHKVFHTLCPGQPFQREWYIAAIVHQLERIRRGEITRLIINLPPRSLKSIITSVAYPAFLLGHDPTQRIICSSYSSELAFKHSNDFRAVLTSRWYQDLFPGTRIGAYKDSETEIELTRRGFRYTTSTGGTLTGRGGNLIIIDDPLKPIDALSEAKRKGANEWFQHTVLSRLDDKRTGAIIIVMQRVHADDLTGFVRTLSDNWTVLSLPAIAEVDETIPLSMGQFHRRMVGDVLSPQREPKDRLEQMRLDLGSTLFSAQYQQCPLPPGGKLIKRDWIKRYTQLPVPTSGRPLVYQSWDTAQKGNPENDYSVCTTWVVMGFQFYLTDVWRERVIYPELKRKVVELAQQSGAVQVYVEEAGTATGLLAELDGRVRGITGVKPEHDKVTRMAIASAQFEAGQVFFPEQAPWLPQLEAELFSFPASRFDDQVDSISQLLNQVTSSEVWKWQRFGEACKDWEPPQPTFPLSAYVSAFPNARWF